MNSKLKLMFLVMLNLMFKMMLVVVMMLAIRIDAQRFPKSCGKVVQRSV